MKATAAGWAVFEIQMRLKAELVDEMLPVPADRLASAELDRDAREVQQTSMCFVHRAPSLACLQADCRVDRGSGTPWFGFMRLPPMRLRIAGGVGPLLPGAGAYLPERGRWLRADQDQIGVLDGFTGADEADGARDALFEVDVGFVGEGDAAEGVGEGGLGAGRVRFEEFAGHHGLAEDAVFADRCKDLQDGGDVVHQREIDGFNFRPEREAAVGDDKGVGVPDAGEEGKGVRVEDAGFEHIF